MVVITGKTHFTAGLLCGSMFAAASVDFAAENTLQSMSGVIAFSIVGSLLPDIDHPKSIISSSGWSAKTISSMVRAVTRHRGFTHTTVFALLMAYILVKVFAWRGIAGEWMVQSFLLGILSHLLLDSLNEVGVLWLWPIYREPISIASIKTGSFSESLLRLILSLAATASIAALVWRYAQQWRM